MNQMAWQKWLLLLCLLLISFATASITGCWQSDGTSDSSTARPVVRVGYLPISTSLPNWIADTEGFAEKHGIQVEFKRFANSNLLLTALLNGEIDATSVCADEPILGAAATGQAPFEFEIYLQEVLTSDRLFEAILVKKDSDVELLSNLKGKTLACFPGSQLQAYAEIILESTGVDPSDVKLIQLPPANMLPALESGTVDALFALEPIITIGEAKGLTRVLEPSPIVMRIGEGEAICAASFLVSSKWADSNSEAADAFVRSVHAAVEMIEDDYARCAKHYPKFTPIPPEIAERVVITRFATHENPDLDGLRQELQILQDAGTIKNDVEVARLIYRWRKGNEADQ